MYCIVHVLLTINQNLCVTVALYDNQNNEIFQLSLLGPLSIIVHFILQQKDWHKLFWSLVQGHKEGAMWLDI